MKWVVILFISYCMFLYAWFENKRLEELSLQLLASTRVDEERIKCLAECIKTERFCLLRRIKNDAHACYEEVKK